IVNRREMNTRGSIFNRRKGVKFRPPLTFVQLRLIAHETNPAQPRSASGRIRRCAAPRYANDSSATRISVPPRSLKPPTKLDRLHLLHLDQPAGVMARTFGTCERDARSRMVKQVVEIARVSPRRVGWPAVWCRTGLTANFNFEERT